MTHKQQQTHNRSIDLLPPAFSPSSSFSTMHSSSSSTESWSEFDFWMCVMSQPAVGFLSGQPILLSAPPKQVDKVGNIPSKSSLKLMHARSDWGESNLMWIKCMRLLSIVLSHFSSYFSYCHTHLLLQLLISLLLSFHSSPREWFPFKCTILPKSLSHPLI